jgi:hypothetical protein
MARRARRCKYGKVKSGPRKGRCRLRRRRSSLQRWVRGRRNPCKGQTGVFYRQCMQRASMARARRILG